MKSQKYGVLANKTGDLITRKEIHTYLSYSTPKEQAPKKGHMSINSEKADIHRQDKQPFQNQTTVEGRSPASASTTVKI